MNDILFYQVLVLMLLVTVTVGVSAFAVLIWHDRPGPRYRRTR